MKNYISNNIFLFVIAFIVIIISIEQLNTGIKWDSANYYKFIVRLDEITFNPNDITLLKNCGHACYAYSLFTSIGENIAPYHGYGVRIQNIIIHIISIGLLDRIIIQIVPYIKKHLRAITVFLFALTPAILGTIQDISPEIYTVVVFLALVYSYCKGWYIFQLFWGIMFVFIKETNIIILATMYIGWLIYVIGKSIHERKISAFINWGNVFFSIIVYVPAILFLTYYVVDSPWGTNNIIENNLNPNLTMGNVFGFNFLVIISKLKQLFVYNFNWLIFLIIGIILIIIIKRRLWPKMNLKLVIPLACGNIAFFILQLFFITYTFPRYIMLQYCFELIWFACLISTIPEVLWIRGICYVNIILLIVQNYYCIDFLSLKIATAFNTGTSIMLVDAPLYIDSNGQVVSGKEAEILQLSPYAQYNKQWSYFDKLMNQVLKKIEYNEDSEIWLPDNFYPYSTGIYWGYWTDNYYDSEKSRIIQIFNLENEDLSNKVKINYQLVSSQKEITVDQDKRIYYLSFSFSKDIDKYIFDKYSMNYLDSIIYRGWDVDIYILD